jgi:hypothetical protein
MGLCICPVIPFEDAVLLPIPFDADVCPRDANKTHVETLITCESHKLSSLFTWIH